MVSPVGADATQLVVDLDFAASIRPGDAIEVASGTPAVTNLEGTPAAFSRRALQAPAAAAAPAPVIAGPASVGAACGAGASAAPLVFDASSTPLSAGRPVAVFVWSSPDATLQALAAAAANSSRLVVPAAEVAKLAAGTHTLQLTATNWLGASGELGWPTEAGWVG